MTSVSLVQVHVDCTCGYCNQTHVQDLYTIYIHILHLLYLSDEHNKKYIMILYYKTCTDGKHLTSKTTTFIYFLFSLVTNTSTLTSHSSSVYVSTGPVTGECPAEESGEESGDRDLNIEQHITDSIDSKLVTYILYLL